MLRDSAADKMGPGKSFAGFTQVQMVPEFHNVKKPIEKEPAGVPAGRYGDYGSFRKFGRYFII